MKTARTRSAATAQVRLMRQLMAKGGLNKAQLEKLRKLRRVMVPLPR